MRRCLGRSRSKNWERCKREGEWPTSWPFCADHSRQYLAFLLKFLIVSVGIVGGLASVFGLIVALDKLPEAEAPSKPIEGTRAVKEWMEETSEQLETLSATVEAIRRESGDLKGLEPKLDEILESINKRQATTPPLPLNRAELSETVRVTSRLGESLRTLLLEEFSIDIQLQIDGAYHWAQRFKNRAEDVDSLIKTGDSEILRRLVSPSGDLGIKIGAVSVDGKVELYKQDAADELLKQAARKIQGSTSGTFSALAAGYPTCLPGGADCIEIETGGRKQNWLRPREEGTRIQISLALEDSKADEAIALMDARQLADSYLEYKGNLCAFRNRLKSQMRRASVEYLWAQHPADSIPANSAELRSGVSS